MGDNGTCSDTGIFTECGFYQAIESGNGSLLERGFHRMKLAKTDQRNRLANAYLNDQIMIMLSPSTVGNFDPVEAVSMWNEAWTPMLTMKPTRQTKCTRDKNQ